MIEAPRRRGRPKGTGLDDTATLVAIAQLRSHDPDLKPTTAIRKLGITDPSVVRRLRDKLKSDDTGGHTTRADPQPHLQHIPLRQTPKNATEIPQHSAGPLQTKVTSTLPTRKQTSSPGSKAASTRPASRRPVELTENRTPSPSPSSQTFPNPEAPSPEAPSEARSPHNAAPDTNQTTTQPGDSTQPQFQIDPTISVLDPQIEAMRLAAEAAAAVSRLYLHCLVHATSISPMAMALRAQAMSGQWLASFFAQYAPAGDRPRKP